MGAIEGDLGVVGFANLFQVLLNGRSEGVLTLSRPGREKALHLGPRGIRLLRGGRHRRPIGRFLLLSRQVSPERLDEILLEQRRSGLPLGEIARRKGILSAENIHAILQRQLADEIYDLFTWSEGAFRFEASVSSPRGESALSQVLLDADAVSILLEAARRADDLDRVQALLPDLSLVPERIASKVSLDDPQLDVDALEEVSGLVNGRRSIAEIVEQSLHPRFTVLSTLLWLRDKDAVRLRPASVGSPRMTTEARPKGNVTPPFTTETPRSQRIALSPSAPRWCQSRP